MISYFSNPNTKYYEYYPNTSIKTIKSGEILDIKACKNSIAIFPLFPNLVLFFLRKESYYKKISKYHLSFFKYHNLHDRMNQPEDYIQQLADYIKRNLSKGYSLEALKVSLMNQGYSKISVENAAELANKQLAELTPPMKEIPQITYKIFDEEFNPVKIIKPKKSFFARLFGK